LIFQTLAFHTNHSRFEDPISRGQFEIQSNRDAKKDGFEKAKNLLVYKNVPFDPEILLTPDWRKTLKSTFDQMPELQEVRRGANRLKGVQMAHTLYLPEKVRLEGDTVILVRNLIFDGHEAVIRGPFSIYVYPVDESGLLGTSYEAALARARPKTGVRFTTASWAANRATRGLPVMPIIRGGTITINTSGLGRAEWLESQRAMASGSGSVRMIKAGFFRQGENKNGAYGGDGAWGVEGAQGLTGSPSPGTTGAGGTCGSTSSVNGGTGGNGNQGGIGLPGGSAATDPSLNGGRVETLEQSTLAFRIIPAAIISLQRGGRRRMGRTRWKRREGRHWWNRGYWRDRRQLRL